MRRTRGDMTRLRLRTAVWVAFGLGFAADFLAAFEDLGEAVEVDRSVVFPGLLVVGWSGVCAAGGAAA
jgi:hypothetical protein